MDTGAVRGDGCEQIVVGQTAVSTMPASQGTILPDDHPDRLRLAGEVHARPPVSLEVPERATYVAVLLEPAARSREHTHLTELCEQFGVSPPAPDANHFYAQLGKLRLKWERHGEFSGYTFYMSGRSPTPFSEPPAAKLPAGWLGNVPGKTLFAAHAKLIGSSEREPDTEFLAGHFKGNIVVGSSVGGGAGLAYTDFKIHDDGFARFLLISRSFTPRQAGRMMQRLFEIEAYRMMALLALPVARDLSRQLVSIERALSELAEDIAHESADDDALLQRLTRLAAEVERHLASSQSRFSACRAYHDLVITRAGELREERLTGVQTMAEFMVRRFTPAAATCASVSQRLHELSERVSQTGTLLSARVEIAREAQNQLLLQSMDRRAKLQLRLQQTLEGFSVAAIVYYVVGLVGYSAKALKSAGWSIDPEIIAGVAIPVVTGVVILALRSAHRRIHNRDENGGSRVDLDL